MKSIILILILSLSLVGSISNSYAETYDFVTSFDGSNGGTKITSPIAITTDSNNRIIVSDPNLRIVQIFDSTGVFISNFNGGTAFMAPFAITADSNNRIIVSDIGLNIVQIFDSTGVFISSFDGSNGGTTFVAPIAITTDSNNRIIVSDSNLDIVQIFEAPIEASDPSKKRNNGGCADCTPPTIGLDKDNKRVVDNGFSYNGNSIQVEKWYTPYPLINATVGEMNSVEIKVFENSGINNMDIIQFGLGAKEIGEPLSELEVLIEVHLEIFGIIEDIDIAKIVIIDKDNLIENETVVSAASVVKCQASDIENRCVQVNLDYSYREATLNNVIVVSVIDKKHNEQSFYFNNGIKVIGESMNPVPYVVISNKKSAQQTEDRTLVLFRTDKVNHIWTDGMGIQYKQISENTFDRITPIEPQTCNDPPLSEINVPTRSNCHFRALVSFWNQ